MQKKTFYLLIVSSALLLFANSAFALIDEYGNFTTDYTPERVNDTKKFRIKTDQETTPACYIRNIGVSGDLSLEPYCSGEIWLEIGDKIIFEAEILDQSLPLILENEKPNVPRLIYDAGILDCGI